MNEHTRRVRMKEALKSPEFEHSPPVVIWWCAHRPRQRILRVFSLRGGWHVIGERFRVTTEDWLQRNGLEYTADDVHAGKALGGRKVRGVDQHLDFDSSKWPAGDMKFEVGCSCRAAPAIDAPFEWLAADLRHAERDRKRIERTIR